MNPKQRADFIAGVHFIFVFFIITSLPLLFIIPWWNIIVLIVTGVTVLTWIVLRDCWFLQLENKWRNEYDPNEAFEDEAFIQHYLRKIFGINLTKRMVRIINQSYTAIILLIALAQVFT